MYNPVHDLMELKERRELILFKNCVKVKSSSTNSVQAGVFFGRERYLGLQVVCKQFELKDSKYRGLLRELKMFSLLEEKRRQYTEKSRKQED